MQPEREPHAVVLEDGELPDDVRERDCTHVAFLPFEPDGVAPHPLLLDRSAHDERRRTELPRLVAIC
eukprot:1554758-Rhodomonas_salina.1